MIAKFAIAITLILTVTLCVYAGGVNEPITSTNQDLYIAGFTPFISVWPFPLYRDIVDLAIEYINNASHILPNHSVIIDWRLTLCRISIALEQFLRFMYDQNKTYKALFGPACPSAIYSVAERAPDYNISVYGYFVGGIFRKGSDAYPTLTLGIPSFGKYSTIWLSIIKYYKWKRVAIIYTNLVTYTALAEILKDQLRNLNIETNTETIEYKYSNKNEFKTEIQKKLNTLFAVLKYRIVIALVVEYQARDIMCVANELGYNYPIITWLFVEYSENWFNRTGSIYIDDYLMNCSEETVIETVNGALGITFLPSREQALKKNLTTIFNVSQYHIYNEFVQRTERKWSMENLTDPETIIELYIFDGILTIAIALHELEIWQKGSIDQLNYKNATLSEKLIEIIHKLNFVGVTGVVEYYNKSRVSKQGQIFEYVQGKPKLLALLENIPVDGNIENYDEFQGFDLNTPTYFGKPEQQPIDGVLRYHLQLPVSIIISILMIFSLAYIISFIVIHIIYRKKKVFRLSSPLINAFLLSGCIIQVLAVIPYLIDNSVYDTFPNHNDFQCWYCSLICHLRYLTPVIAKDLIFGSLIGKSFRLYVIAVRQSLGSKITDLKIIVFILLLIAFDVIINVIWGAAPSIRMQYITNGNTLNDIGLDGHSKTPYRNIFDCVAGGSLTSSAKWYPIIYFILRSFIYLVGIFLAFKIRNVNIRGVNDFTAIAYTTLITIILTFIRIFLTAFIFSLYDFAIILICISFLTDGVFVVSAIFIPKLYFSIKDPAELKLYTNLINETTTNVSFNNAAKYALEKEIELLSKKRDTLQRELVKSKEFLDSETEIDTDK